MNIEKKIDEILARGDRKNSPGCALGIIKDGEIIYRNYFGMANLEHEIAIDEKTVFNIGSIAKQFTAVCIALLEEKGELNINDSIKKYIEELPDYCNRIKIKDLVFMTNGIRDFYHISQFLMGIREDDSLNEEEALKLLSSVEAPLFDVGEKWSYGNSGYFLLGIIVKRLTGKSLAQLSKELIFDPLGMKNTFYRESKRQVIKNRAQGYCRYGDLNHSDKSMDKNEICKNEDNYELLGAGQVWTTLEDLIIWDNNFYNNKLGKDTKGLIDKLITPGRTKDGTECPYGYGLFLEKRFGKQHIYHGGSTAGYISMINRIQEEKTTVIFLSNSSYEYFDIMDMLGSSIDKYLLDSITGNLGRDKRASSRENVVEKVLIDNIENYEGCFQCMENASVIEIKDENGELVLRENRESRTTLKYKSKNVFINESGDVQYKFFLENEKKRVEVSYGDRKLQFHRFIQGLDDEALKEYCGEYYCEGLDTKFIVKVRDGQLFMMNTNRGRNGIDFAYEPSIEDCFINFNDYSGTMYISFYRDNKSLIKSFVFRDYDGDNREIFVFKRSDKNEDCM